ncbi:hypothetical protein L195_g053578 [Trifolium pratense]|uniref:Uncharacterized protein n=1 Tax=Trifolium pratense TaxID=57577 RepID=A0A2K3KBA6_TRIPR|nr:hypothetical protein L195_g053578 [Trifolium pratense]
MRAEKLEVMRTEKLEHVIFVAVKMRVMRAVAVFLRQGFVKFLS